MEGIKICFTLLIVAISPIATTASRSTKSERIHLSKKDLVRIAGKCSPEEDGRYCLFDQRMMLGVCSDSDCVRLDRYWMDTERRMPGREPERKPTGDPMADSKDATVTLPETTTMQAKYTTEEEEVYTASCIEVRIAEEVKYRTDGTRCSEGKWNGTCFQGQCVQTYLSRDRSEWDDDTGDGSLCPDYELSTTTDGAVTKCTYSCVEGPAEYYVDVLNGMLCAVSKLPLDKVYINKPLTILTP